MGDINDTPAFSERKVILDKVRVYKVSNSQGEDL